MKSSITSLLRLNKMQYFFLNSKNKKLFIFFEIYLLRMHARKKIELNANG